MKKTTVPFNLTSPFFPHFVACQLPFCLKSHIRIFFLSNKSAVIKAVSNHLSETGSSTILHMLAVLVFAWCNTRFSELKVPYLPRFNFHFFSLIFIFVLCNIFFYLPFFLFQCNLMFFFCPFIVPFSPVCCLLTSHQFTCFLNSKTRAWLLTV